MKNKMLITGFDPFGGEKINPSWEAVKRLPDSTGGWELIKRPLPVGFKESPEKLKEMVKEYRPDVILNIGQAGGRNCINIERIAINVAAAGSPDNFGCCPSNEILVPGGPDGMFSNLPILNMKESLVKRGIPCVISNSAGTYVCNATFYHAMYLCQSEYPSMRAGFVHLPYIYQQVSEKEADRPAMDLHTLVCGLEYMIGAVIPGK